MPVRHREVFRHLGAGTFGHDVEIVETDESLSNRVSSATCSWASRIWAALEATGEADNTVVVFVSDNGYLWGEHRQFFGKDAAFDESIRVPLIIRAPGLVGGPRQESRLALNIDLAPTLAAMAGVTPSSPVDGVSLVPLLRDVATDWRTDFLVEHFDFSSTGLRDSTGVRTGAWKYTEYSVTGDSELYDLVNDPDELQSRHADPAYAVPKEALRVRLNQLRNAGPQ